MSASLVGSEMCIRDSLWTHRRWPPPPLACGQAETERAGVWKGASQGSVQGGALGPTGSLRSAAPPALCTPTASAFRKRRA
eukprot:8623356-Alexandrium_andersonii.AAC.1